MNENPSTPLFNEPQRNCPDTAYGNRPIRCGAVLKAMDGHAESGDQYLIKPVKDGILVAAIDGLGHGEKAAVAAKAAVTVLEQHADEPLIALVNRCHKRLVGTRGVVMSLALINSTEQTLTWLGIGNVHGVLVRADRALHPRREALMLRGGTVGYRIPSLRTATCGLSAGDTLVFVSDGVRSGFVHEVFPTLPPQRIADHIFENHARGTDDTLVLVIQYKPPEFQ